MSHYSQEELHDFINVEVSSSEREKILEHLKGCDRCRKALKKVIFFEETLRGYFADRSKACPDRDLLFDYAWTSDRSEISPTLVEHIKGCRICSMLVEHFEVLKKTGALEAVPSLEEVSKDPGMLEVVCKEFIRQKVPNESALFNSVWKAVSRTIDNLKEVEPTLWSSKEELAIARNLGFTGAERINIVSPLALLVIWGSIHQLQLHGVYTKSKLSGTIDSIAKSLGLSQFVASDIQSFLEGIFFSR